MIKEKEVENEKLKANVVFQNQILNQVGPDFWDIQYA